MDSQGPEEGSANFFCEEPDSNILGFAGCEVFVTATQLCRCSAKAAMVVHKQMSTAVLQ